MFVPRTLRGIAIHGMACSNAQLKAIMHSYAVLPHHRLEARLWLEQSQFQPDENRLILKALKVFLRFKYMFNEHTFNFILGFLSVNKNSTEASIRTARENKRRLSSESWEDDPYKWRALDTDDYEAQGLFSVDHNHKFELPFLDKFMEHVSTNVPPEKRKMVEKLILNVSALCIATDPQATKLALANIVMEFVSVADVASSLLESIDFKYLSQLFVRAIKYIRDPDAFTAQGLDPLDPMSEEMFGSLFRILSTAYAFIFDPSVGNKPVMSTEWQRSLFATYRNTNSIPDLIQFFFFFIRSVTEFVQVHVLGVEPDYEKSLTHLDIAYSAWTDELYELEAIYMDKEKGVTRQSETRRRILAHYKVGQRLSEVIEKAKLLTRGSYQHFMALISKSSKMAELARSCGQADRFRVPPYMIQIQGPSGIGKSTCLERLGIMLNKCEAVPVEEGNIIHTRNQASPYWEGYANQLITCYDDLFQIKDLIKRAEIADELIRVCNSIPMTLNMANVEAKGNVIFTSKYVVATTNIFEERSIGMAHPDALWRRFNSRWEFNVPEKYRGDRGPNWSAMARDNPDVPYEELLYRMMQCTLVKKSGERTQMTFKEFTDYVICDSKNHYSKGYIALEANRKIIDGPMEAQGSVTLDDSTYPISVTLKNTKTRQTRKLTVKKGNQDTVIAQSGDDDEPRPEYYVASGDICRAFGVDDITVIQLVEVEYSPSWSEVFFEAFAALIPKASFWRSISESFYGRLQSIRGAITHRQATFQMLRADLAQHAFVRKPVVEVLTAVFRGFNLILCMYCGYKQIQKTRAWWQGDAYQANSEEWRDKKFTPRSRYIEPRNTKPSWHVGSGAKDKYNAHGSVWSSDYLKKIRLNLARVELCADMGDEIVRDRQNVIFVTGSIAMCTAHFAHNLEDCNPESSYIVLSTSTLHKKIYVPKIRWLLPSDADGIDVALIDFRDSSIQRGSIIERFMVQEDLERARIADSTFMQYVPNDISRGSFVERSITNASIRKTSPVYTRGVNSYQIADYAQYSLKTAQGDCGSVVLHNDLSKNAAILGIHVAGRAKAADGFAQIVTRELLCSMLGAFGVDTERVQFPDVTPLSSDAAEKFAAYGNIDTFGVVPPEMAIAMPTKTKIKPSMVHGVFQEPTHAPAMLKKTDGISPSYIALEKANIEEGNFNIDILIECEDYMVNFRNTLPTYDYARTLTNYETVNGFKGTNHLNAINIHTSPGYPYVKERKAAGKLDWFGQTEDGTILVTKKFLLEIETDEELLAQGKIPFYPFTSCLKDEKRPIEKVKAGKTRLFSAGNQKHLFICRKYYGGYNAFLTANKDHLCSKVGIAANGPEFHEFHKYMTRGRTNEEALHNFNDGDFSAFDDSIMGILIRSYFECAMQWYAFHGKDLPGFERDQKIRKNIIPTFMGPPHIIGKIFYSLTKANSSGNFATVHINGHANELIHRYAFLFLGEEHQVDNQLFDDKLNLATYGDDSLMCLSDDVVGWYNGLTLGPVFSEHFGMTYTPANKSSIFYPVRDIQNVDFCKRKFHYNPDLRRVVGIMPLEGLLETTNWIKESVDDEESTIANVESTHREIFLHSRELYDEYSTLFVEGCNKKGVRYIPKSYRSLKNVFYKGLL
jgi:hypothetical protein